MTLYDFGTWGQIALAGASLLIFFLLIVWVVVDSGKWRLAFWWVLCGLAIKNLAIACNEMWWSVARLSVAASAGAPDAIAAKFAYFENHWSVPVYKWVAASSGLLVLYGVLLEVRRRIGDE